ncbi:MAG: nitroreductase family protein, partial [Clostridia bacterium]|nr:nitroreductase family protein [Clostridia bacterium]
RSIRKYRDQQIREEQLQEILLAGEYAPSGMGAQPVTMIVIQNKQVIEQLSKLNAIVMGNKNIDPFYGAPTVIAVLADKNRSTCIEDGSLVIGNLMNAAHALGVDSCWIHRAKEVFESAQGRDFLYEWGLNDNYVGVGNCILGYRDCEYPEPIPRKENFIVRVY